MAYGGSDPDTQLIVDRFMEGYSAGNYESRGSITEISYFANTTLNQAQVNTLYNDGKAYDVEEDTTLWSACTAYWRNNGLAEWQDRKGTNDLNTNSVTETMLITAGVDGSRDSQGFLMNRQRATNSLNFYNDGPYTVSEITTQGALVKCFENPLTEAQMATFSVSFWVKTCDKSGFMEPLINLTYDNSTHFQLVYHTNEDFTFSYEQGLSLIHISEPTRPY